MERVGKSEKSPREAKSGTEKNTREKKRFI